MLYRDYMRRKMRTVKPLKGFIRTILDIPPLTLPNCVDNDSLVSYSLTGEGVGDKTKNLVKTPIHAYVYAKDYLNYNPENMVILEPGSYTVTGTTIPSFQFWDIETKKQLIVTDVVTSQEDYFQLQANNKLMPPHSKGRKLGRFTVLTPVIVTLYAGYGVELHDCMLVAGETQLPYEPYGYKIPITVSGKNLFDKNEAQNGSIMDEVGTDIDNSINRIRTGFIYLKAGTYTISARNGIMPSYYLYFYSNNNAENLITVITETRKSVENIYYVTFTINEDYYFRTLFLPVSGSSINNLNIDTIDNYDIQLEEGLAATEYELYTEPVTTNIYLDEPLKQGEVLSYPTQDIPKLPTVQGTTIYSVETETQPTNMSVKYYSAVKG